MNWKNPRAGTAVSGIRVHWRSFAVFFAFAMIVIDLGGGQWIIPELRKPEATINGHKVSATSIVLRGFTTKNTKDTKIP